MAFGTRNGGGRRSAKREASPLPALLTTLSATYKASIVDLSATGARLKGGDLPEVGTELQLKVDKLQAFAVVCWKLDEECGVEFDLPLSGPDLAGLRREVWLAAGIPPAMQEAYQDWLHGRAR